MTAYHISLQQDTDPETCLGYRSQIRTAKILAKEYIKDHAGINESWSVTENGISSVQFFIGETLWIINFEEINIEF